jgi:hypothetical protein
MRHFFFGVLIASAIWGYFAGGREQLIRIWANVQQLETAPSIDELAREREQDFADSFKPDVVCATPRINLRSLECQNQMDMARSSFYARWNRANADRFPK